MSGSLETAGVCKRTVKHIKSTGNPYTRSIIIIHFIDKCQTLVVFIKVFLDIHKIEWCCTNLKIGGHNYTHCTPIGMILFTKFNSASSTLHLICLCNFQSSSVKLNRFWPLQQFSNMYQLVVITIRAVDNKLFLLQYFSN